jgi:hypothetical protein
VDLDLDKKHGPPTKIFPILNSWMLSP